MEMIIKYETPAVQVVEVKTDSCILQLSQKDYDYGDLDEEDD